MDSGINNVTFYTDGAFSSDTNIGGWAFYSPELNVRVTGSERNTTINRMELIAVISTMFFILKTKLSVKDITIFSDSMYVIGCLTKEWIPKNNTLYWRTAYYLKKEIEKTYNISFIHIHGHSKIEGNEIADKLAVKMTHLWI
jgi:ribonuclease HI